MCIIAFERDNHYNSKTKNNSNDSEIMHWHIIHIIGSGKNNHNNSSQINRNKCNKTC
jgi:hypothetical protein